MSPLIVRCGRRRNGSPAVPTATDQGSGSHSPMQTDRKSTRLNSSHSQISYAVFCLKKKNFAARSLTRFAICSLFGEALQLPAHFPPLWHFGYKYHTDFQGRYVGRRTLLKIVRCHD